jgi:hypothetical protein
VEVIEADFYQYLGNISMLGAVSKTALILLFHVALDEKNKSFSGEVSANVKSLKKVSLISRISSLGHR